MHSKTRHEGYLMIDERAAGGALHESPTITCCHCNSVFIKNPNRVRPRNYCSRHDAYVCDNPGCITTCTDWWGMIEKLHTALTHKESRNG